VSHHVFVRPARPEEAPTFLEWSRLNSINKFDPEVARQRSTTTFCAFDNSGPLAYVPFARPIVLDSFAPRPGLDPRLAARTMKAITQTAVTHAAMVGAGEIMFLGVEDSVPKFALNQIYEELPWKLYRVKIKDLEP